MPRLTDENPDGRQVKKPKPPEPTPEEILQAMDDEDTEADLPDAPAEIDLSGFEKSSYPTVGGKGTPVEAIIEDKAFPIKHKVDANVRPIKLTRKELFLVMTALLHVAGYAAEYGVGSADRLDVNTVKLSRPTGRGGDERFVVTLPEQFILPAYKAK